MRTSDRLTGPLLVIAVLSFIVAMAMSCGGSEPSIAGSWRAWFGVVGNPETPLSGEGRLTFDEPHAGEVDGQLVIGGIARTLHGKQLPEGWTLSPIGATQRQTAPQRMTFSLGGELLLVLERTNARHGKTEVEQ